MQTSGVIFNNIKPCHYLRTANTPCIRSNRASSTNYKAPSLENLKANYMVSFKGVSDKEFSPEFSLKIHETHFFREPNTDEIVQNYILNKFSDEPEINIVSGACSSGEEAKSYAMMLDSLGDKLKISGFDISDDIIKVTNDNTADLRIDTDAPTYFSVETEKMLFNDNDKNLTPYEKKCREQFRKYYTPVGKPQKVPAFPNVQKELDNTRAILNDKKRFKEEEKKYLESIKMIKDSLNEQGMSEEYMEYFGSLSYKDTLKMSIRTQEKFARQFNTIQKIETSKDNFKNCQFKTGDIFKLEQLYEPNSVNVLLYRNALYHSLCTGDNMIRYMSADANEKFDYIAKQMNKIVKKDGLVVFGEKEYTQGVNTNVISSIMENNGFELLSDKKNTNGNIWVKVKDVE